MIIRKGSVIKFKIPFRSIGQPNPLIIRFFPVHNCLKTSLFPIADIIFELYLFVVGDLRFHLYPGAGTAQNQPVSHAGLSRWPSQFLFLVSLVFFIPFLFCPQRREDAENRIVFLIKRFILIFFLDLPGPVSAVLLKKLFYDFRFAGISRQEDIQGLGVFQVILGKGLNHGSKKILHALLDPVIKKLLQFLPIHLQFKSRNMLP